MSDQIAIEFDVPASAVADNGIVEFRLTFDVHFVPRDLGMNDDARELVVHSPTQVGLHRRGDRGMTGNLDQPRRTQGE